MGYKRGYYLTKSITQKTKKAVLAGTRCKDVFFTFVQKGESIYSGFTKSQIFYTLEPIDRVECHVYLSDLSNPRFIDDESSRQLGILEIQLPELKNRSRREIRETMTCLLYTSPSPRDLSTSRMPSSA